MTRKCVLGAVAVILCLWSLGAGSARADLGWPEWMPVASNYISANAIYFFDATHAAIADGSAIYYLGPSNPVGLKWDRAAMPPGISLVRQIRFIQGKLYAASAGTDVLISLDSGKSWTYSGLGLINANDVYADGTGTIRALQDPMVLFARLDTMHCIAQGNGQIFVSNNGGVTWTSTGVPMVDSSSLGAFADRCKNIYVCPNSWGTVFHSTDLGQTWQTSIAGSGPGSEYLNGASSVIYLSSAAGMIRSTDDGSHWKSVITVNSDIPALDVWGQMGEEVAVYGTGGTFTGIWLTTTGGLDDLHGAPSMTDSNGAPLEQQDTMNVPLELSSTCQPFLIPVTVESDVDSMTVRIAIADSLGDFALAASDSTISLRKGHEDTVWMQYDPHHPVANVVLTFENHWNCSDWTETRSVHVEALPNALINPPPIFAASCIPDTEAALIRLDSCEILCIDSVEIPPDIAARLSLATALPDTALLGSHDSLLFAFNSSGTPGTVGDSIVIFAHYLGLDSILDDYFYFPHAWGDDTDFSFFYTTVPVTLRSLPSAGILSANDSAIVLSPTRICETRDTFLILRNVGCDTVCIDSASLAGSGFTIVQGQGRDCLASGEYDTLQIAAVADTLGHPLTNVSTLTITSSANSPLPPIVLSRQIAYPVTWSLRLSPAQSATAGSPVSYQIIQSGSLPPDVTTLDFTVTYNDNVFSFVSNNPSVTYSRTPDGLAHLTFHLAPVPIDSIVATLNFIAYVSGDTQTTLSLENILLADSQSVSTECIASITTSQSSFTLLPQCGTTELSNFLKKGIIEIDNIDPNPAQTSVRVEGSFRVEGSGQGVEAELVDDLGRAVIPPSSYALPFNLDVSQLPNGIYFLRISSGAYAVSRSVAIER